MSAPFESSIVRIYAQSGKAIGAGFLVGQKQILTCAHVVAYALGYRHSPEPMPEAEISLDFPLLDAGKMLKAKVVFWRPVNPNQKYEDIAGLELIDLPPTTAKPVRLVTSDDFLGHQFE